MPSDTLASIKRKNFIKMISLSIVTAVFFFYIGIFDLFINYTRSFEDFELDEIISSIIFITITYLYYSKKNVLEEINHTLLKDNIKKEQIIYDQSKMASMGEMIANITHQWKQPLSIIYTSATAMQLKQDLGLTPSKKDIDQTIKTTVKNVEYLSNTIDIFSNFMSEEKIFTEVNILDRIHKSLQIVAHSLNKNHITLKNDINYSEPILYSLIIGELCQVLINIINNAIDALQENNIQEPWIKIDCTKSNDTITITIEDNAGGIPEDIIPKIFDQYFTTKPKNKGTGIGLYMSHQIITKSMKGKLYVQNSENGAKFFIELPL